MILTIQCVPIIMPEHIFRSKSEIVQQEALREYYKDMSERNRNEKKILACKRFTQVHYPAFCLVFVVIFWVWGIKVYREE